MAELLSTILLAYVLLTVASWRLEWLTDRWIVVGLAGTAIPDLVKIDLLLDEAVVGQTLGIPFTYAPLGTLAGVVLVSGAVTLAFTRRHWRRVFPLVISGGLVGLLVDGLRVYADGRAGFYLYPLWWRPPTPSLFVSADPRVLVVTAAAGAVVFAIDRYVIGGSPESSSP
jgi:hypothetical protein